MIPTRRLNFPHIEQNQKTQNAFSNLSQRLQGKPFWIVNQIEHESLYPNCCFNHIIGLPKKDGTPYRIFDYEIEIAQAILKHKRVWVKKATGLGITEFMLRFMAWLALRDNNIEMHGQMFAIVTGPRIELAIELIARLKRLFTERFDWFTFDDKNTVAYIGGVKFEAFPSHHLDAMRGLHNVKFIFLDEADFFPIGQQRDARDVSERYIGKTDAYICMVSTPNLPFGLFESIEREPRSLYHRIQLDWRRGLGKIYTQEDIARAQSSPSFEREYNLKYAFGIGNLLSETVIKQAEALGLKYLQASTSPLTLTLTPKSMGIDPGLGSSKTAIVITELIDGLVHVLYSKEFERPDFNDMIRLAGKLIRQYDLMSGSNKVWVDGSQAGFIRSLKIEVGEYSDYERLVEKAKHDGHYDMLYNYMQIVPVSFSIRHKAMLENTKKWLEKGMVAIDPSYQELLRDLRIARVNNNMALDKTDATMDCLDALRLSMELYK